jgi:hypothetical protein
MMIITHLLTSAIITLVYVKLNSLSKNKKLLIFVRDLQMPLAISFSLGSLAYAFMNLKDDSLVGNSIFPIMALKMLHIVIGSFMSMVSDLCYALFSNEEDGVSLE